MKFAYTMRFGDFRAAYRMLRRSNWFLRYDQVIWAFVLLAFVGLAIATANNARVFRIMANVYTFPLVFAIGLPILRNLKAYLAYRDSRAGREISPENTTEITETQIIDESRGVCVLSYAWSSVIGIGQDKKITLIALLGGHLVYFPTAALNSQQREEFDELANRYQIRRWS